MQTQKAIPFIYKHNNSYQLTEEAENLLSSIQTSFSVVSVAGLYRTGKSYLLNRVIINRNAAFNVGPTINPCTKGLWIWAQPIQTSSGKTLLVVDTEGLGALDEQNNHDMKIFCLAVLLSSNFIYNSMGSIDEQALQTLSFVLNFVSNIDQSGACNKPNFLWIVRDFALQLVNDKGENLTSNQYLQLALNADIQKQTNKKQLRKTILQAFEERACFTLIKPLIDQQKLQNIDQIPPQQLRVQFISQTNYLRNYIMDSLKDFKMNNAALTGKQYVMMIKSYLQAINNNALPDLLDTWGYIKQAKQYELSQKLRNNYIQRLNTKIYSKLPMTSIKLAQMLNLLKTQLIQEYIRQSYVQTIPKEVEQYFTHHELQLQRINREQTIGFINQSLKKQYQPFHKKLLSNYYISPHDLQNDIKNVFKSNIEDLYSEKLDIPENYIQLYTEKKISECIRLFYKRSKEQLQHIKQIKSQLQSTCLNQIKHQTVIFTSQRQRLQQDIMILEKKLMMSQGQRDKLGLMLSEKQSQKSMQINQYQKKMQQYQNQIVYIEQQMVRSQLICSQAEKNVFALRKQLEKQKALSLQKIVHLQTQLEDNQKKQSAQQHQFSMLAQTWQFQRRKLVNQLQMKIQCLIRQKKELIDQINELNHQVEQQKFVNNSLKKELQLMKQKYCSQFEMMKEQLHNSSKKQKKQDNEDMIKQLNRAREKIAKYQQECTSLENKYKTLNQQLKISKSHNDKQEAIHTQTIQFKEQEIKSLKEKYIQIQNLYQKKLSQPNSNPIEMDMIFKKRIKELQMDHMKNIHDIEDNFQNKERTMKQEIGRLLKQSQELQIKLSLQKKYKQEGDKQLKINYMNLQQEYDKLMSKFNLSTQRNDEIQRENNRIFNSRLKMLEDEIQMLKDKNSEQMAQHSRRSQSQISSIRQYMETQRMKFQKKMEEIRQKNNIKEKEICQEWRKKISQEREQFQQNVAELQQKQQLMMKQYSQNYQAMKCDFQIKIQKMNNIALEEKIQLNKKYALLQQEYEMSRQTQMSQMQEKTKQYHISLQSQKKDMLFQFQQQIQSAKIAMQELQGRNEQLKKSLRKAQQSNLLLKSQSDKQKALYRQKQANYSRKMKDIQQRYSNELKNHNRLVEELNSQHIQENKRMNGQIERLRLELSKLEEQNMKMGDEFAQQKSAFVTKYQYMQGKCKRVKQEYEDILKKFETTVKSLSNQKNQKDLQKQMQQSHKRLKDQYNKKIAQKEESINQQKKDNNEKIKGLQTQNKSLRDKLLMYEMRQSSLSRYEHFDANQKEMYQKVINELRQQLQKEKNQVRKLTNEKNQEGSFIMQRSKLMDQRQQNQHLIRMERSRLDDKEERQSFLSEQYNQKALNQNKGFMNRKPTASIKKVTNLQDFGGIMRWKNQ